MCGIGWPIPWAEGGSRATSSRTLRRPGISRPRFSARRGHVENGHLDRRPAPRASSRTLQPAPLQFIPLRRGPSAGICGHTLPWARHGQTRVERQCPPHNETSGSHGPQRHMSNFQDCATTDRQRSTPLFPDPRWGSETQCCSWAATALEPGQNRRSRRAQWRPAIGLLGGIRAGHHHLRRQDETLMIGAP